MVVQPHVVRAAVVQAAPIAFDAARTLEKVEALARQAAGQGAELIVFPEAFVSAYPRGSTFGAMVGSRTPDGREQYRIYWDSAIDVPGPAVDRLAGIAGENRAYLVIGVVERDGGTLYCTVLFFGSDGRYLGKHRKLMPTASERLVWGFGDVPRGMREQDIRRLLDHLAHGDARLIAYILPVARVTAEPVPVDIQQSRIHVKQHLARAQRTVVHQRARIPPLGQCVEHSESLHATAGDHHVEIGTHVTFLAVDSSGCRSTAVPL